VTLEAAPRQHNLGTLQRAYNPHHSGYAAAAAKPEGTVDAKLGGLQ
jgi:hypothetical protein